VSSRRGTDLGDEIFRVADEQAEVTAVRNMGALVQRLVGIGAAVAPGFEAGQNLTSLGSVSGQRQGGQQVEADAGGL